MTERFPRQRGRSAQHIDDTASNDPVFDESFVAAALVREPSAADRVRMRDLQRHLLPDQRADEAPLPVAAARWTVRPSHHLAAVRPLPAVAALVCMLAATALLIAVLF